MLDDVDLWRSRCDVRPRSGVASSRRRAECPGTWRGSWAVSHLVQVIRCVSPGAGPELCLVALSADVDDDSLTTGHRAVMSPSCLEFASYIVDRRHLQRRRLCLPCFVIATEPSTSSEYDTNEMQNMIFSLHQVTDVISRTQAVVIPIIRYHVQLQKWTEVYFSLQLNDIRSLVKRKHSVWNHITDSWLVLFKLKYELFYIPRQLVYKSC